MSVRNANPETLGSTDSGRQLQEFVQQLTASQSRIRAFLVTLMPGSPDVGDVVQETNLTLWKSRAHFEPGTNFMAWAFTIARFEVLNHRKRAKRHDHNLLSLELLEMLADDSTNNSDHETYLRALDACKSKLTETQRQLIDSRYQADRSLEAYALETGRKASALRVALMRIRIDLRACIERSLNESAA